MPTKGVILVNLSLLMGLKGTAWSERQRDFSAKVSSSQMTKPPSPQVMVFPLLKEKHPKTQKEPSFFPLILPPKHWAASSTT